jgi:hypothetical protein
MDVAVLQLGFSIYPQHAAQYSVMRVLAEGMPLLGSSVSKYKASKDWLKVKFY